METLLQKNQLAQQQIESLKSQIEILKKTGVNVTKFQQESDAIITENRELATKIAEMKSNLVKSELLNGEIQIEIPSEKNVKQIAEKPKIVPEQKSAPKEPKPAPKESKPAEKKAESSGDGPVDVSRFDMRVGRILEIKKNPEADSLYVEQVDVGEARPRQVVSGLVKYCAESELLGRLAVFLVNLKPAKMRGALSEGMIMCASSPDTGVVEPLSVPESARPGDRVTVEGYAPRPDDVMNPKKKILETVKPELRVDADGVATYRGAKWVLNGEAGVIVSKKLKDVPIA